MPKSPKTKKRPAWDEYFLNLAKVVRERSACLRDSVGVVLIKDKRIIATGYNGTPIGIKNCIEGGCKRCLHRHHERIKPYEEKEKCICLHAEQNSLLQSAYHGMSTKGATMYSTIAPCIQCAKAIINAGVSEVVYFGKYSDNLGVKLLSSAGVKVRQHN